MVTFAAIQRIFVSNFSTASANFIFPLNFGSSKRDIVHYRSPLDYHENSLEEAHSSVERVYNILKRIKEIKKEQVQRTADPHLKSLAEDLSLHLKKRETGFIRAMDDDFTISYCRQIPLQTREKIKNLGDILGIFQKEEKTKLGLTLTVKRQNGHLRSLKTS